MSFFVSCIFCLVFNFPLLQNSHPHTHTHWPVLALSQAPPATTTTNDLFWFVFIFCFLQRIRRLININKRERKKSAELFLFEFFDAPSRKLLKRAKVSQQCFFFLSKMIEEEVEADVVRTNKKHPLIQLSQTYIPISAHTHIRVLSKINAK